MIQLLFLAIFPWIGLVVARLIAAFIRRLPDTRPIDDDAVLLQQIDLLRSRPQADREELLYQIKQRLAV